MTDGFGQARYETQISIGDPADRIVQAGDAVHVGAVGTQVGRVAGSMVGMARRALSRRFADRGFRRPRTISPTKLLATSSSTSASPMPRSAASRRDLR